MPHFVVDCSELILNVHNEETIIEQIHLIAYATGLFDEHDIKVRVNPFQKYSVGNKKEDFIHVFTYIMEGRTIEQKANLAKVMVKKLTEITTRMASQVNFLI